MRIMIKFVVMFLLVVRSVSCQVELPAAASLSQIQAGSVKGIILDRNGKRLRGATITIKSSEVTRRLKSDRFGELAIELPPGVYSVTVEHKGSESTVPYMKVEKGLTNTLTINLLFPPSSILSTDPQSLRLSGKVRGTILNWACEALSEAKLTFSDKKRFQTITPDHNGHFGVDLPPGDYQVTVQLSAHSARKIESRKLIVNHNKKGELCLWVNTGIEATHCYCFEPDIEDMMIPVKPIISDHGILERKPIPVP